MERVPVDEYELDSLITPGTWSKSQWSQPRDLLRENAGESERRSVEHPSGDIRLDPRGGPTTFRDDRSESWSTSGMPEASSEDSAARDHRPIIRIAVSEVCYRRSGWLVSCIDVVFGTRFQQVDTGTEPARLNALQVRSLPDRWVFATSSE
jgi:hypothetical protein